MSPRLLLVLGCVGLSAHASAPEPTGPEHPSTMLNLTTLTAAHPRLLLTPAREAALRDTAAHDALLTRLRHELRQGAEWAVREPVVTYELVGPRLLAQSRAALAKISALALAYRLFGDERYAERAWRELAATAAFPDWNPSHFLDTAELCTAHAIAYDWLHDWLGAERRKFLREVIITKGLLPGRAAHAKQIASRNNNWNPVCNAGLVLAALAIADDEPQWAAEMLGLMTASLPRALQYYGPDGAWYEGPGYWKYGTTYLVMLLDGLQTALGHDGGFSHAPGLARTGEFFRDAISPGWRMFNYADSNTQPGTSPTLFWLAHRYAAPEFADFERALLNRFLNLLSARAAARAPAAGSEQAVQLGDVEVADLLYSNRFFALELVWYHPGSGAGLAPTPASSSFFRGVADVALMHGTTAAGFFAGFKGAGVPNAHAHLDAGSFVFEALGERWGDDLGPEDYDLPGYWEMAESGRRWTYFRLGSRSHNVVTINGRNQRTPCRVPLTHFFAAGNRAVAVADLAEAYAGQVAAYQRGVALRDDVLLVQDEITGAQTGDEARWAMITAADIELHGDRATLRRNGKTLEARVLAPAGAHWQVESAQPATAAEKPNPGHRLLTLRQPLTAGTVTRIVVTFALPDAIETTFPLPPLADWPATHR